MAKRDGELILQASCATRCGSRSHNEDNLRFSGQVEVTEPLGPLSAETSLWLDRTHVFCVCDGIGGAARGELASGQALRTMSRYLSRCDGDRLPLETLAVEAAEAAHNGVLELYRSMGLSGGCTLVMVILRGGRFVAANIGDSPAFRYEASTRKLTELTQAHTQAWFCEVNGRPCPEGQGHRLAFYLGKEGTMAQDMIHITCGTLEDGDRIVLCSDGVTNGIPEKRWKKYIRQKRSAAYLTGKASAVPGSDNCTAICLSIQRTD